MMTKMPNLPKDLAEEILSRVSMTSLRRVRSTCKEWNTLSKDVSFAMKRLGQEKAREKDILFVAMMDFEVYLMRLNLDNDVQSCCIKREGKATSLDDSDQIDVRDVIHCDGLLLCVRKDNNSLVVWNPYQGKTRWIEPILNIHGNRKPLYKYALGYATSRRKSCRSYKVLRFCDTYDFRTAENKIYYVNSDSWRVLDYIRDSYIYTPSYYRGISIDGNTYWFATEDDVDSSDPFLLCFDFTRERFSRRLPLPFQQITCIDIVTLSSVKEKQLAVLINRRDTSRMEIWVTNEIKPNKVSWRSKCFLALDMRLPRTYVQLSPTAASFFIDEEKKVAVIFDQKSYTGNVAYIVGVNGSLKRVDLGESKFNCCLPLVCSYVPSLVQLN